MVVFTAANLAAVKNFGEFEFWFAALKVGAIVLFLALGTLAVFGLLPDTDPVGLTRLTGEGGFLPNGWSGVISGVIVVFVALLSALNANLYGASRMVFSLAERGEAPKGLLKVGLGGVPRRAVLASVVFGFVSVLLNLKWPESVFLYMLNSVGAVLLFVWALIAVSQLRLRRRLEREAPKRLTLRMWGFPWLTWVALAAMAAVLGLMLTDDTARPQVLWSGGATAGVLLVSAVRELRERRR
jgi:L-asparagine transporter-like permease